VNRLLVVAMVCSAASAAQARNGGLYFELAPSWGFYFTDEVVIEDGDDDNGEFPEAGFVPQLKLGVNLFGWAGVEADIAAFGWDLDDVERGGGGFVGGAFRITPLEILTYILPETAQIPSLMPPGPVTWKNRPFDLGIYMGGGWGIVGEDYAYQGGYFKWGFDVKFFITPQLAVGIDIPFRHALYRNFRYVDYNDSTGFCTDGEDAFGYAGDTKVDVTPNPQRNVFKGVEVKASDAADLCDGDAPGALLFAPALTIAGVFDFGI
jgi:hypothetical protein